MNRPRHPGARVQRGAINKYLYAGVVALAIAGFMGFRMFRQGLAGFDSFTLFMSLAGVVAMIIVAPGKFTQGGDKSPWQGQRAFEDRSEESTEKKEDK